MMLQKLVVARVPRGRMLAKNTFKAWDGSLLKRPSRSIDWVDTLADKHLGVWRLSKYNVSTSVLRVECHIM